MDKLKEWYGKLKVKVMAIVNSRSMERIARSAGAVSLVTAFGGAVLAMIPDWFNQIMGHIPDAYKYFLVPLVLGFFKELRMRFPVKETDRWYRLWLAKILRVLPV